MLYVKPEYVSLKGHPELNEKWVQQMIVDDPSVLGLGDLMVKDSERTQPSGGRLDLLLQDPENNLRYEVELQLGASDESHIIRTIEYWDFERRRYPQYKHCAVLVAEDITSRFLNVISLFNGHIPIIAIQMKGMKMPEGVSLLFSTVLDAMSLGTEEEDEGETVDRRYWEAKSSRELLSIVDSLLEQVTSFAPDFSLKYNKYYVGLAKGGLAQNFVTFVPQRKALVIQLKHDRDDAFQKELDDSGLSQLAYDRQFHYYRVRLTAPEVETHKETLKQLFEKSYRAFLQ